MSQKPANRSDRLRIPQLRESIGEDPARYLDHDLFTMGETIMARIKGIDSMEVLEHWRFVEKSLDRDRERVLRWLEQREAALEEIGDRDDRDLDDAPPRPAKPDWRWCERQYDSEYNVVGKECRPYAERPTGEMDL